MYTKVKAFVAMLLFLALAACLPSPTMAAAAALAVFPFAVVRRKKDSEGGGGEEMVTVDLDHSVGLRDTPLYGPGKNIKVPKRIADALALSPKELEGEQPTEDGARAATGIAATGDTTATGAATDAGAAAGESSGTAGTAGEGDGANTVTKTSLREQSKEDLVKLAEANGVESDGTKDELVERLYERQIGPE